MILSSLIHILLLLFVPAQELSGAEVTAQRDTLRSEVGSLQQILYNIHQVKYTSDIHYILLLS